MMNTPPLLHRFRLRCILPALLLPMAAAVAQWTTNTVANTQVSMSLNDHQNVTLVSDGAGGAILVWEEDSGGTDSLDIIAQRIDALGNARWGPSGVAISSAPGNQRFPVLAPDGSGGAIIAWYDERGTDTDIYAQRVDAGGTVLWATNGIPLCLAPGNQWDPVIVPDSGGGAIIAWYEARFDTAADIYAQRINSSGVVQWAINGVPLCTAPNGQVAPVITADNSGGAIVAWLDFRNGVVELFSQRVNQTGAMQWTPNGVRLCNGSGFQYAPAIAGDGSGGAIVTWHDFRSVDGSDVYAQRISNDGILQWASAGVGVAVVTGHQYRPQLVPDGASGAIMCWYDFRAGVNADIFAQRVSYLGVSLWAPNGIALSAAVNDQLYPTMVSDRRGGAFVGWQDTRNGSNPDIFAQHVNASGAMGFAANGVPVSTAANGQFFPRLVSNSSGGAILVWGDRRSGTRQDLYTHRIVLANPDGAFGMWAGGIAGILEGTPAYAGVHQLALDGTDARDILEPPTLPADYVSITALSGDGGPSERFIQDIRQETARLSHTAKRWSLQSRTSAAGSPVNLVFTEDRVPIQFTPVLYETAAGSYQNLRTTPVFSYTSPPTSGDPVDLLLLLGDSTRPSVSIVAPNGGEVLLSGFPYTIRWNASDSSGLLRHYLSYNLDGGPIYTMIDSTIGVSTSYVWTPSQASVNAFVRIVTVDSVLNMTSDTSDASFAIVAGDSIAYTTLPGWNMIGVPTLQEDMSPRGIFADDLGGEPIVVYGFNAVSGYVVPDTLRLGRGYWLRTSTAQVIDAVGTVQASVSVPLSAGWNMIGNPFPVPFPKSMLRFTDGVTTKTIGEARAAGWLADLLYGFGGGAYFQEDVSLAVWNGYWLRVYQPNLTILYNLTGSRGTLSPVTEIPDKGDRSGSIQHRPRPPFGRGE